jgi:hypothetical protein
VEGIVFLGIAWLVWIIATFFMKRNSIDRSKISFMVLILIILSPFQFSFFDFQLNTAAVTLYLYLLKEVIQLKNKIGLYLFITSFIIMLAYVSFLMLELYDPVWVIFDRKWMIGIILVYLCLLLEGNKKLRYYTILIGTLQGEWLFSLILNRFSFSYPVGTYAFFDTVGLSLFLLGTWNMLELATVFLENQTKHLGRGKQKTS